LLRGQAHGPADLLTSRESSRVPKNGVNAFVAGAPERGPRDDKRRVRTRSGEHHRLPSYGLTSTMTVRHILTGTPYFVAGRNRALRTPSRTASLTPLLMGIPCWSRASTTLPVSSTSTKTITLPEILCSRAMDGYTTLGGATSSGSMTPGPGPTRSPRFTSESLRTTGLGGTVGGGSVGVSVG